MVTEAKPEVEWMLDPAQRHREPGSCIRVRVDLHRARPHGPRRTGSEAEQGNWEEIWPYGAWLCLFTVCRPRRKTTNTCLVS